MEPDEEQDELTEEEAEQDAAMAKKEARQARFRAQQATPEGREQLRRLQTRYMRSVQNGRTPLSGGKKPQQPHLSKGDYIVFMTVAAIFDFLAFLLTLIDWIAPGIGSVLAVIFCSIPASLIFYLMYKKRGIDLKSAKVAVRFFGGMLLGIVPILNSLPEMMLAVTLMFTSLEAEEKLKNPSRSE